MMDDLASGDMVSLFPDPSSGVPLARQLTQRLRHAIRSGALVEGSRLLPTREFAARMGVSRNTVVAAVDQLVAEGYLVARVGSGTYVAKGAVATPSPRTNAPLHVPLAAQRYIDTVGRIAGWGGEMKPFRTGVPDINAFPTAAWDRYARRLRTHPKRFAYGDPAGSSRLRRVLAEHLRQFRGLMARPEEIIIVDGAQSALALIADVMLSPGDRVLLEDPSYSIGRYAFAARGATIVSIPTDENGIDASNAPDARLMLATPSHQYPLGGTMSVERRRTLLEWADEHDAYVIEDDYDGEFRFGGAPLPAMQGGDRLGRVIYVGTFSKVLAPGLRIGYIVSPPHLAPAFRAARTVSSLGANPFTQLILAEFIADGYLARHVRRQTTEYRNRAERLNELLRPFAGRLIPGPATGGIHLAVRSTRPIDDLAVAHAAYARGLLLHPLSIECIERSDLTGFVLGFGMAPIEEMPAAVETLAAALQDVATAA